MFFGPSAKLVVFGLKGLNLGAVCLCLGGRNLRFDSRIAKTTNFLEANKYLTREYRPAGSWSESGY